MKLLRSICLFCFLAFGVFHLVSGQENVNIPIYFSQVDASGIPQLKTLTSFGQAQELFPARNDGYFDNLSPDRSMITLLRYDWDASYTESRGQLWVANLDTGVQWPTSSSTGKNAVGIWSPDSRYILVHELEVVSPLWAGYNYGKLTVYDSQQQTSIIMNDVYALPIGWYPDSQSILLWNENTGYFRYSVDNQEIQNIQFAGLEITFNRWGDMSPIEAKVAISAENGVEIYDAITGELLQTFAQNQSKRPYWSPNGNYIAIELNSNNIAVWDYRSTTLVKIFDNPASFSQGSFYRLGWGSNSKTLILTVESNNGVSIYQADIVTDEFFQVYETP